MEAMSMEEAVVVVEAGPDNDHLHCKEVGQIVNKGKRTKRQRPHSPIPFTITTPTHLSDSTSGGDDEEDKNKSSKKNKILNEEEQPNNNRSSSPAATSSDYAISTTAEDEDAARLLLLLARGNSTETIAAPAKHISDLNVDQDYSPSSLNKSSSKRFVSGGGGLVVYECKTCNRTFSSFQALGGHRASHKKPKNLLIESKNKQPFNFGYSDDDYVDTPSPSPFTRNYSSHSNLASPLSSYYYSSKIHECSYCGAEFTSGQALGGHMRRHRGSIGNLSNLKNNNGNAATDLPPLRTPLGPLSPISVSQDSVEAAAKKQRNVGAISLSLDLNLPAPEPENGRSVRESPSFSFSPKQQHQHQQLQFQQKQENQQESSQQQTNNEPGLLLFKTPTLVDCHY